VIKKKKREGPLLSLLSREEPHSRIGRTRAPLFTLRIVVDCPGSGRLSVAFLSQTEITR
jgi:hypothetical protein